MLPIDTGMAPTGAELELARRHVAEAEKAVDGQRAHVDQLRRQGYATDAAERLLATFEQVLRVMREHLTIEESFAHDKSCPTA